MSIDSELSFVEHTQHIEEGKWNNGSNKKNLYMFWLEMLQRTLPRHWSYLV